MNRFKIGYNFHDGLADVIQAANEKFTDKACIDEVFASIREHAWLAARPDFRIPDVGVVELKKHVSKLADIGVVFNYTLNTIFPGSRDELISSLYSFRRVLSNLKFCGITRITVANPLVMQLIREVSGSYFELEVSTIAHIDNVSQIQYLHEQYGLRKVCIGIHKNRSFRWLRKAAQYCNENGIEAEILANEFCANGGVGYSTHCTYRDSCYLLHATDRTVEDTQEFDGYPMAHCMTSRGTDSVNWLRTRFVRPQDLHYYNDVGINKFKLSGRTGSLEYMEFLIDAYMSGTFSGNLLSLWKPLETITSGESELEFHHEVDIPTDRLDGFLDHWADYLNFECANVLCGTDCTYCEEFYNEHILGG